MNSPAISRVGSGGCPGPTRQTELKRLATKSQSIFPASTTSAWRGLMNCSNRQLKQVVLTIVAWLAHGSPSTANLAVEGIMSSQSRESQNARKPTPAPGFLAKSNTCSDQISPINQALRDSSRTTNYLPR